MRKVGLFLLMVGLASWMVCVPGCKNGNKKSNSDPPKELSSHERMVKALAEIVERVPEENKYFGDKKYKQLNAMLSTNTSGVNAVAVPTRLGEMCLNLGKELEAIDAYSVAFNRLNADFSHLPEERLKPLRMSIAFSLAMAYLRRAETQNCCQRNTPDSCVVPIQGEGIHTDQTASKMAIKYFRLALADCEPGSAEQLKTKWLLNIACMTVGGYPQLLSRDELIPQEFFRSETFFPSFRNISNQLGLDVFSCSGGAIVDDFDNDYDLDVVVSEYDPAGQLRIFRNDGDEGFVDITESANLQGITGGLNLNQADFNNDGWLDIFVMRGGWFEAAGRHPNSLLRNNGDGTFTDITFDAGLAEENFPTQTSSWADYDLDGDLDLLIGNEPCGATSRTQLFENNGDETFTDVAVKAGIDNVAFTKGVIWGDYNNDRYPDFYVSNFDGPNRLYRNNGDRTFTDVAPQMGVTEPRTGFPCWFWDYDNDGKLDLFAASYTATISDFAAYSVDGKKTKEPARLYRNEGDQFRNVAGETGVDIPSAPMGSNFGDLNNSGYLDFYLGTGWPQYEELVPNLLFVNQDGKKFADVTMAARLGHLQKGHGVTFADLDHDGDVDIFMEMGGAFPGDKFYNAFFENPGFGNHWIALRVVGTSSNRSAIGTRIKLELEENGKTRFVYRHVNSGGTFGANPLRQHIGLGKATTIKSLEVFWPRSDTTQRFENVAADQFVKIVEGTDQIEKLEYRKFDLKK